MPLELHPGVKRAHLYNAVELGIPGLAPIAAGNSYNADGLQVPVVGHNCLSFSGGLTVGVGGQALFMLTIGAAMDPTTNTFQGSMAYPIIPEVALPTSPAVQYTLQAHLYRDREGYYCIYKGTTVFAEGAILYRFGSLYGFGFSVWNNGGATADLLIPSFSVALS